MSGPSEYFHSSLAKIREAVTGYREGLARIDLEFDAACARIDDSIAGLQKDGSQTGRVWVDTQDKERQLRQQSGGIQREIAQTDAKITAANQGLAAVNSEITALAAEKSDLEKQISDRWLIVSLYYYFAEESDEAKKRCRTLQTQLDSAGSRKSALERTKRDFETIRRQEEARRTDLQKTLEEIDQKLAALEQSKGLNEKQSRRLVEERKLAETNRERRRANWLSSFANDWAKAVAELTRNGQSLLRQQPAFEDFCRDHPAAAPETPAGIFLGSQHVAFQTLSCLVPYGIAFPFSKALVLPEDNAAQRRLAHQLLLRLISTIPPGQLELTVIDPLKLGQSIEPFLPLLKVEQLVPQQRVLTRSGEIEATLERLTDDVEELVQHRFSDKAPNWSDYNATHADNPLPYRIVLVFDVPEQLSEKSLWFLGRLCENGPRCGVLPVVAIDGSRIEDKRYERFRSSLSTSTVRLDSLLHATDAEGDGLALAYQSEPWPPRESLNAFFAAVAERCAAKSRFGKSVSDLWSAFSKAATTIGGFEIPIGWTPAGETVSFVVGGRNSEHHALLAGKTGSGKSNLLHVLIHTLCERYGPGEVDLYLLDYKESTEFTVYAHPPLPHARLVATESDPEYGVTVLRHLVDELEQRATLFKTAGVRDFAEYRNTLHQQLPRVLLVIDEFQVLFSEGWQASEVAERLLAQLLKQGRSFGIHVVLATQTLKGINALSLGAIITQLGCRIALACGQEDSAMILGSNNWGAAELRSPPEAMINTSNGASSGNIKFLVPLAEAGFCREHIARLSERAAKRKAPEKTRVFNGSHLPCIPAADDFQSVCSHANSLLLGETLTFAAQALTVPLVTRNAFNVLFSGYNDRIHDGLLASTLRSMAAGTAFDRVVYFNARNITPAGGFTDACSALGNRFEVLSDTDTLPLQDVLGAIGKSRVALIIDGLDSEKSLQPVPFKQSKPGEPPSPADLLKRICEEGSRVGTFVFAFIDNWRRCAGPCKDLFSAFELRVAYCMNEDDAGALVSGGIGKFKGIERPNRAVFVNRMTNENTWFRPYVQEGP